MVLKGVPWLKKRIKRIEETNSGFKEEIGKIKNVGGGVFNDFKPGHL